MKRQHAAHAPPPVSRLELPCSPHYERRTPSRPAPPFPHPPVKPRRRPAGGLHTSLLHHRRTHATHEYHNPSPSGPRCRFPAVCAWRQARGDQARVTGGMGTVIKLMRRRACPSALPVLLHWTDSACVSAPPASATRHAWLAHARARSMRLSAGVPDGTGEGRLIRRSPSRSRSMWRRERRRKRDRAWCWSGIGRLRDSSVETINATTWKRHNMEVYFVGTLSAKHAPRENDEKHGQGEEGGLRPPGSHSQTRRSRQKPCVHPAPRRESIVYFGLVDPRPLPPSEIARRVTDTTEKSVRAFHVDSNGLPSLKRGGAACQPHGESTPSRRPRARVSPVT